jgi:hypothetical protein
VNTDRPYLRVSLRAAELRDMPVCISPCVLVALPPLTTR